MLPDRIVIPYDRSHHHYWAPQFIKQQTLPTQLDRYQGQSHAKPTIISSGIHVLSQPQFLYHKVGCVVLLLETVHSRVIASFAYLECHAIAAFSTVALSA